VDEARPTVCILHTGRAAAQMLLGRGYECAGGAELQLAKIALQLHERGWPVIFALNRHGHHLPSETPEGIRLVTVNRRDPSRGLRLVRFFVDTLPGTHRLIAEAGTDICVQMGVGWQSALVAWSCRGQDRRFVLWLGSVTDPVCDDVKRSRLPIHERWLGRYGLRHADVIVAQTKEQQRLLKEHQGRDSVVIRNLWPVGRTHYVSPADPPEVLLAASLRDVKRPHLFLDVAEALRNVRFVMAGGPAEGNQGLYDEVKARAEGLVNVDFLGFVPFREIDKYYARASAYLCTSTIEGFPNTFLQAWSHGRPVVSTFDPDEVICEHNLGFHCQDLDELVSAVRTACENSSDYAERVRTYLRKYHSPEVIMPQIERVLLGA